jgi:uroporphyrinogen decarboxylase
MTSGIMPLLDQFVEAGIDVLIGIDPVQGKGTSLAQAKAQLAGRTCLWGGVNGFLTIEQGSEAEVREAVEEAIGTLAPGGGFILSPVDNVTADTDLAWHNVLTLVERWLDLRG